MFVVVCRWYRGTVAARYLAQYETLLAVDSCRSDSNGDSVTRAVPCSPGVYAMSELCRVLRRTCPVRVEGRARARGGGRWWVNVLSTNAGARTVALVVYHLELGFFPDCSRGGVLVGLCVVVPAIAVSRICCFRGSVLLVPVCLDFGNPRPNSVADILKVSLGLVPVRRSLCWRRANIYIRCARVAFFLTVAVC